jgi:hypothetical protein
MRVRIVVGTVALAASLLVAAPWARTQAPTAEPATVALDWNANAVAAVRAARVIEPLGTALRPLYQTEGLLYMAYVQAAVYDAATKIAHRYRPYHHFSVGAGNASLQAAVIAAAYKTLSFYLGDPDGSLTAKYNTAIAALPDDRTTTRGIAVGQAAAADIEALRANDGRNAVVSTPFGAGPPQQGLWVWAPSPSLQSAQTPWVAVMQPFMLESTSQFRAPPPPALTSAQYGNDLNETAAYGSATSTVRSVGPGSQTETAWFWNANAIEQVNKTLRDLATQHDMDLVDTARLLAMGTMVPSDAGMACFDSKYTYQLWRPITAIRNADVAANPVIHPDSTWATWTPLVTTPNHPEYPSQHGCVTSALAEVLANAVGTTNINVTIFGAEVGGNAITPSSPSRTFATVQDIKDQLVNARVWGGFHYRNSVVVGENLGTAVADWELQRYFLRNDDQGD